MHDDRLESLGRRIRTCREMRGFSQEDLADKAGLHRTYVGQLEMGYRNPSYLVLLRLSDALDIPIDALLGK